MKILGLLYHKGLTQHRGQSKVAVEMVDVISPQTPRKERETKAPRQDSTISGSRLGIAIPRDRAAASQGCEAAVSVYKESPYLPLRAKEDDAPQGAPWRRAGSSELLAVDMGVPALPANPPSPLLSPVRASDTGGQGTIYRRA